MRRLLASLGRFARAEAGQDLLEYGLVITLIAVAAVAAVSTMGNVVNTVLWQTIAQNF